MKSLNTIKSEQRSIAQTRKITNAMYLLSASRMKKSLAAVSYTQRYMLSTRASVKAIIAAADKGEPYFTLRPRRKAGFLVIASDKSLCGGYNSAVVRTALNKIWNYEEPIVTTIGLSATQLLSSRGVKVEYEWPNAASKATVENARKIGGRFTEAYDECEIDEFYIVYTRFINQLVQEPRCLRLLPISADDFSDIPEEYSFDADTIFEPSRRDVMNTLIPQYVIDVVYAAMNYSVASENIMRMNAMKSATDNAGEMLKKLSSEYSAARQLAITNEIIEISSATEMYDKYSV